MNRHTTTHTRKDGELPATAVEITHHEHGRALMASTDAQVVVDGLDGGTFTVQVRVPGSDTWREHTAGASTADVVKVEQLVVRALRCTFAGLGAGADPVVVLTTFTRFG